MKDLKGLKIHCDNDEEKKDLLEEATRQGFVWGFSGNKPLETYNVFARNDFRFDKKLNLYFNADCCISYKEYRAMSEFTKADLKPCMVVVRRNGVIAGVVENKNGLCLQNARKTILCYMSEYRDDLKKKDIKDSEFDIVRVYGFGLYEFDISTDNRPLLWERKEEPQTEEMTLSEVCKALGKNIKIVKE